jgi:hypothetical protein
MVHDNQGWKTDRRQGRKTTRRRGPKTIRRPDRKTGLRRGRKSKGRRGQSIQCNLVLVPTSVRSVGPPRELPTPPFAFHRFRDMPAVSLPGAGYGPLAHLSACFLSQRPRTGAGGGITLKLPA